MEPGVVVSMCHFLSHTPELTPCCFLYYTVCECLPALMYVHCVDVVPLQT